MPTNIFTGPSKKRTPVDRETLEEIQAGPGARVARAWLQRSAARPIQIDRASVDKYMAWLKGAFKEEHPRIGFLSDYWGRKYISFVDVKRQQQKVLVDIQVKEPKTPGAGPILGARFNKTQRDLFEGKVAVPLNITIDLSSELSPETLQSKEVLQKIEAMLYHELTHAADYLPLDWDEGTEDLPPRTYLNHPLEVRANMRKLYEEIAPTVRLMVGRYGLSAAVSEKLRGHPFWKTLKRWLTPANTKLILKGLMQAFIDEGLGDAYGRLPRKGLVASTVQAMAAKKLTPDEQQELAKVQSAMLHRNGKQNPPTPVKTGSGSQWTVYLFSNEGETLFEKPFPARDKAEAERIALGLVKPLLRKYPDAEDWVVEPATR